jgi:hypothetical protein
MDISTGTVAICGSENEGRKFSETRNADEDEKYFRCGTKSSKISSTQFSHR